MLSLLGSLLGFGTSFLPKVMNYFQQRQDNAQELKVMQAQADIQLKLGAQKLAAAAVIAAHKEQSTAIRSGSRWLANLSGSIRPVVTYLFVLEYLIINASIAYLLLRNGGFTIDNLKSILDSEFMGLLSTMLSFWFGNRTFGGRRT